MIPEATVVIPAYNAEQWIEVMLASLDAQIDAPSFEVIIADNGSTDDTAERVRIWADAHDYVRLIDAAGVQGASHARNEGIRAARTGKILMCDADDAVSRHWVRLLTEALSHHRYAGGSDVAWPFSNEPTSDTWVADHDAVTLGEVAPEHSELQGIPFARAGNCAIRREVIIAAGGWDESLRAHEDPELALRLARQGIRMEFVEDAVIYYRQPSAAHKMFRTHVRYALPRPGIVSQYADLGLQGSVRAAARDMLSAVSDARQWRHPDTRQRQAARLGDDVGYLLGWAHDRVAPRRPMTPLAARPGMPPAVVIVSDQLIRPNGILSSIEILAGGFADAGVPVIIVHEGHPDPQLAASFITYDQKPGWRLTTQMPDFINSRTGLKPLRTLFTRALWRPWTQRRNRAFLNTLPPRTLVIGAGLDATRFLMEGAVGPLILIAQVHLSYSALDQRVIELVNEVAGWAQATTALTEQDAEQLTSHGTPRCVAMPNPVRIPDAVPAIHEREKLAVYIGRLGDEKQVDQTIRAFSKVAPADWRLEIYGQGPMENLLAKQVEGTHAGIRMMGTTTDIPAVLRRASLNILTSRAEGLPMSVLEAGSWGVPTVAYDCAPGVRQAMGAGGVLLPVNDEEGIAATLAGLMADDARRAELSAAAVDHARRFSADRLVARWADLWRSLAGTAPEWEVN